MRRCIEARSRQIRFAVVRIGPRGSATVVTLYPSERAANSVKEWLNRLTKAASE